MADAPLTVAALYDLHGNLPALEAVLDAISAAPVDLIVVGGDIVTGPMPRETLERLLSLEMPVRCLRGNADREVVAAFDGSPLPDLPADVREVTAWVARQLDQSHRDFLAGLPDTVGINTAALGPVLFCHASPVSDQSVITRVTPDERVRPLLEHVQQPAIVCGHTHMQFDRRVGSKRLLNAGSVGMPYGEPGAYWLLLGREITFMRTEYDRELAARRIRMTGYPFREEFARSNVLSPPSEEEAIAALEGGMATSSG